DVHDLSEYKSVFYKESISGAELLDLSLDELQHMGVKKLGHRKKMIKLVETLKQGNNTASPVADVDEDTTEDSISVSNTDSH
ncbi:SAM domain-containing protein, partial [Escherichia coli]|nr:SAM domain-containing protein [Escherichia coli]